MPKLKSKQLSNTATWFKLQPEQQTIINDIFSLGRELERYVALVSIMSEGLQPDQLSDGSSEITKAAFNFAVLTRFSTLTSSQKTAGVVENFHQDKKLRWIVTLKGEEHVGKERDKYMSKSMEDLKKTLHTALSSGVTWDYLQSHDKEGRKIPGETVNGLWWRLDAKPEFVELMRLLSRVPKTAPALAVALDPGLEHLEQAIKELCEQEGVRVKGRSLARSVSIVANPMYVSDGGGGERAGAVYYATDEDTTNAANRKPVAGVSNPMYAAPSSVGGFDGAVGGVVSQGAAAGSGDPLLPLAVREHLLESMKRQGYEVEDASPLYATIAGDSAPTDMLGHLRGAVAELRADKGALASLEISDISTNVDRCLACLMAVIVEDRYKHLKITQANILKALTDEDNTLLTLMAPFYGIEEWEPSFAQVQNHWIGDRGKRSEEDFHAFLVQCLQAIDPRLKADSFAAIADAGDGSGHMAKGQGRIAVNAAYGDAVVAVYAEPLEQTDGDAAIAKALVIQMIAFAKENEIEIKQPCSDQGDDGGDLYATVQKGLNPEDNVTSQMILANYKRMNQGSIPAEGFSATVTVMARMVEFNNDLTKVLAGLLLGTGYEAYSENVVQAVTYEETSSNGSDDTPNGSDEEEDDDGLLSAQNSGSASLRTADATYSAATIDLPEEQENVAKMLAELNEQEDTTLSLVAIRAMHQQCAEEIETLELASEEKSEGFTLAEKKQAENSALLQEHAASMLVNGIVQFAQANSYVILSKGGVELSADNQESKGKIRSNYREKFPDDEGLTDIVANIADVAVVGELLNETGFSVTPPPRPARLEHPLVVNEDGHDSDTGTIAIDTNVDSALALAQQIEGSQNELSLVIPDAKPNEDRDTYSRVEALHNGLDQTIDELAVIIQRVDGIHRRTLQALEKEYLGSESLTSLPQKLEDIRAKQAENAALLHGHDELMMAVVPEALGSGAAVIDNGSDSDWAATTCLDHMVLAEQIEVAQGALSDLSYKDALESHAEVGEKISTLMPIVSQPDEHQGSLNDKQVEIVAKQVENQALLDSVRVMLDEIDSTSEEVEVLVVKLEPTLPGEQQVAVPEHAMNMAEVPIVEVKKGLDAMKRIKETLERLVMGLEAETGSAAAGNFPGMLDGRTMAPVGKKPLVAGVPEQLLSAAEDLAKKVTAGINAVSTGSDINAAGYLDVAAELDGGGDSPEANASDDEAETGSAVGGRNTASADSFDKIINTEEDWVDDALSFFSAVAAVDPSGHDEAGSKAEEVVKPEPKPDSGEYLDVAAGGSKKATATKLVIPAECSKTSQIMSEGKALKQKILENKSALDKVDMSQDISAFHEKVVEFKKEPESAMHIKELNALIQEIERLNAGITIENAPEGLSPGKTRVKTPETSVNAADKTFSDKLKFFNAAAVDKTTSTGEDDLYAEPAVNNNPVYHVVSLDSNQEGAGTGLFESPSSTNSGSDVANDDEEDTYNQVTPFAGGARMVGKTAVHVVEVDPDCDPNATQLNPTQPREDYELDGEGVAKEATGFGNVSL